MTKSPPTSHGIETIVRDNSTGWHARPVLIGRGRWLWAWEHVTFLHPEPPATIDRRASEGAAIPSGPTISRWAMAEFGGGLERTRGKVFGFGGPPHQPELCSSEKSRQNSRISHFMLAVRSRAKYKSNHSIATTLSLARCFAAGRCCVARAHGLPCYPRTAVPGPLSWARPLITRWSGATPRIVVPPGDQGARPRRSREPSMFQVEW